MAKQFPIHRVRLGKEIIAECALPHTKAAQKKGRVAVLLPGAPSSLGKSKVMECLARKGFFVVFPRYRGTWESAGSFLKEEPTEDVRIILEAIQTPLTSLWTGESLVFPPDPKIFIFASSFGGPAGLLFSADVRVRAVVAFSPVVDWTMRSKAEPLEKAFDFMKLAYGEGYRMDRRHFDRLGKTVFYDPRKQMNKIAREKILIFHAEDDDSVPFSTVLRFSKDTGVQLIKAKKGGHFGLDELVNERKWLKIRKFIGL